MTPAMIDKHALGVFYNWLCQLSKYIWNKFIAITKVIFTFISMILIQNLEFIG